MTAVAREPGMEQAELVSFRRDSLQFLFNSETRVCYAHVALQRLDAAADLYPIWLVR